jgi:hypothetical protein
LKKYKKLPPIAVTYFILRASSGGLVFCPGQEERLGRKTVKRNQVASTSICLFSASTVYSLLLLYMVISPLVALWNYLASFLTCLVPLNLDDLGYNLKTELFQNSSWGAPMFRATLLVNSCLLTNEQDE